MVCGCVYVCVGVGNVHMPQHMWKSEGQVLHSFPLLHEPQVLHSGRWTYILSCLTTLVRLALNLNSLTYFNTHTGQIDILIFNNSTGQIPILILGMGDVESHSQ